MGDMADWIIENGEIAALTGEDIGEPSPVRCRNCGEDGLHWWQEDDGRWIMYTSDGKRHNCPVHPLKEDKP